jgi:hypothetical protein
MAKQIDGKTPGGSKVKKWIINLLIALIVTVITLSAVEMAMRWIDGYQLSTLELQQDAAK